MSTLDHIGVTVTNAGPPGVTMSMSPDDRVMCHNTRDDNMKITLSDHCQIVTPLWRRRKDEGARLSRGVGVTPLKEQACLREL